MAATGVPLASYCFFGWVGLGGCGIRTWQRVRMRIELVVMHGVAYRGQVQLVVEEVGDGLVVVRLLRGWGVWGGGCRTRQRGRRRW